MNLRMSWLLAVCLLTLAGGASASQSAKPAATGKAVTHLRLSDDQTLVLDHETRQAWSRCVEGMQWTGKTCAGEPVMATHKEALALAAARRKADGKDWRLPRVPELRQLALETEIARRTGLIAFPHAPDDWYWTSTANVDTRAAESNQYNYGNIMRGQNSVDTNRLGFLHGWAVDLRSGEARGDVLKRSARLPVLLVRSQDGVVSGASGR